MARELHNWLVNCIHDKHLIGAARLHFRGRLIDIGCGTKPFQQQLSGIVREHVGVDHADCLHNKGKIDVVAPAYHIPIESSSFDSALSTAVLEHLEEPEAALRECHRVLKNGGIAIYSVPFIWHIHEKPRDFYRFSKYGLKYLFEKVGFEIVEIRPLSGFIVTFGQLLVYYLYAFNRGPLKYVPVIPAIGMVVQAGCYLLNKVDRTDIWTWAYLVVARARKESTPADIHARAVDHIGGGAALAGHKT